MNELSLRAQLSNLEALRSSLHSSFRFWDWVVVAGVALEFVVLIVEYFDERSAFRRATIRLPEKPKSWLFLIGFLGIAMVAGGITKELKIDSQIEGIETQIKGVNEQLFGIVSKEAEEASSVSEAAKLDAKTAHDEANEAKASAKAAGIEAGTAQQKAEAAEASTERTGELAAATEQELTDEHNKRMELEKSLTPRDPFLIKYENGKAQLPNLTGFQDIKFDLVLIHDAETVRAGGAILNLLKAAGWTRGTTTFVEYGTLETPEDGVSINWFLAPRRYDTSIPETEEIVKSWMRCEAAGLGLIVFLLDHDWEARESIDLKNNVQNTVRIKIGFKPSPYFFPLKEEVKKFKSGQGDSYRKMMQFAQRELREQGEHPWVWPPQGPK